MCAVNPTDVINTQDLRLRLGIDDLDVALRRKAFRWFGHVQRSTSWIGRVCSLDVGERRSRGRPRKTWCEVLRNDLKLSGLRVEDAENRAFWRSKTKIMQRHTRELSGSVTLMDSEWVRKHETQSHRESCAFFKIISFLFLALHLCVLSTFQ